MAETPGRSSLSDVLADLWAGSPNTGRSREIGDQGLSGHSVNGTAGPGAPPAQVGDGGERLGSGGEAGPGNIPAWRLQRRVPPSGGRVRVGARARARRPRGLAPDGRRSRELGGCCESGLRAGGWGVSEGRPGSEMGGLPRGSSCVPGPSSCESACRARDRSLWCRTPGRSWSGGSSRAWGRDGGD